MSHKLHKSVSENLETIKDHQLLLDSIDIQHTNGNVVDSFNDDVNKPKKNKYRYNPTLNVSSNEK